MCLIIEDFDGDINLDLTITMNDRAVPSVEYARELAYHAQSEAYLAHCAEARKAARQQAELANELYYSY